MLGEHEAYNLGHKLSVLGGFQHNINLVSLAKFLFGISVDIKYAFEFKQKPIEVKNAFVKIDKNDALKMKIGKGVVNCMLGGLYFIL